MELILDIEGPKSKLVSKELADRYRGFSLSRGKKGSQDVVRALNDWVLRRGLAIAGQEQMLAALSFHVSHHPRYPAMRSYASHCHDAWSGEDPHHLPSFEQWCGAGDAYFED
jgi:hypothetical protein